MYDPSVGRWLSEDPIEFDAGDANLMRYVGNNPTNATDPSGLFAAPPPWQPPDLAIPTLPTIPDALANVYSRAKYGARKDPIETALIVVALKPTIVGKNLKVVVNYTLLLPYYGQETYIPLAFAASQGNPWSLVELTNAVPGHVLQSQKIDLANLVAGPFPKKKYALMTISTSVEIANLPLADVQGKSFAGTIGIARDQKGLVATPANSPQVLSWQFFVPKGAKDGSDISGVVRLKETGFERSHETELGRIQPQNVLRLVGSNYIFGPYIERFRSKTGQQDYGDAGK